jgi:hypothetical protein
VLAVDSDIIGRSEEEGRNHQPTHHFLQLQLSNPEVSLLLQ